MKTARRRTKLARAVLLALLFSPMMLFNLLVFVVVQDRRRFFPVSEYPELMPLAEGFSVIRGELLQLLEEGARIPGFAEVEEGQERLAGDGRWKTFIFRIAGIDVPSNRRLCAKTSALLDQVPGISTAMFSILEPGKRLPLHIGSYKGVLRYHLPLLVGDPDKCGITVGGETRRFEEGTPLLFDDVYLHTAWNDSQTGRVVLFIDIERRLPYRWLTSLNRWGMSVLARTNRVRKAASNASVQERESTIQDEAQVPET